MGRAFKFKICKGVSIPGGELNGSRRYKIFKKLFCHCYIKASFGLALKDEGALFSYHTSAGASPPILYFL